MMLGLSLSTFTWLHTFISLIGIATGVVAMKGMLRTHRLNGWTTLFLVMTTLTTLTGFLFPSEKILPSHVVGITSLIALGVVAVALYVKELRGVWRGVYIAGAVFVLYLNTFVGVVQSFQKVPFLRPLAPTQSEPVFLIAQAVVLVLFIAAWVRVSRRFHPDEFGAF